ncbi:SCP1-like small phosphatase 4b [Striga asiatica]|uniref:SCP1-like small phosphatase 4b n=1 Tax=Striga asiatica TaxID=4170 RepID=A0A5A7PXD9_STRAF|nr:SCP1-like small phosphatase 4b [Striga asiatica]
MNPASQIPPRSTPKVGKQRERKRIISNLTSGPDIAKSSHQEKSSNRCSPFESHRRDSEFEPNTEISKASKDALETRKNLAGARVSQKNGSNRVFDSKGSTKLESCPHSVSVGGRSF